MRTLSTLSLLVVLALSTSCATLKKIIGPTLPYTATFCAAGAIPIKCVDLGTVNVPEGGIAFANLVTQVAGPELLKAAKLKNCVLTPYPPDVSPERVKVKATAVCHLRGVLVEEEVTVTLIPVVDAPPPVA